MNDEFLVILHAESSATVCRWCLVHERKVRAAQDAPLVKMPAVGDGRCREKRTTAPHFDLGQRKSYNRM